MRRCLAVLLATCLGILGLPPLEGQLALGGTLAWALGPAAEPEAESEPASEPDPEEFDEPDEDAARAAIVPVTVDGELSEADRSRLSDELVAGLRRGNFDVIEPEAVGKASPKARACNKPVCFREIAKQNDATHVVRPRVIVRDRDYQVVVELIDGKTGETLASSTESCEICGVVDAGNLLSSAAATLRTKLDALARGPSTLNVTSSPKDAVVTIDGEIVGTTPLQRPVIPGKRVVRVTKDGFIAIEREVTFVEGVEEKLAFNLEKVPSRLPARPWGWVSLGVGIATLGGGIAFAALDDRPFRVGSACDPPNNQRNDECRHLWDTEAIGYTMVIAGAALTTLGIAILINTAGRGKRAKKGKAGKSKKTARRRSRPRVGVGPGSFTLFGRF